MIEHAWTVLCDRTRTDRDSNNISLDTVDQLLLGESLPSETYVVPYPLEVVSLWYRGDVSGAESARVNINYRGPLGENVAQFPIDLTFAPGARRMRSRHIMRNIMIVGVGTHHFVVELVQGGQITQVSRIPFEIARPPQSETQARYPARSATSSD